jgi:hypothetical protein
VLVSITAAISGLFWDIGANMGYTYNLLLRPVCLGCLVAIVCPGHSTRAAILVSCLAALIADGISAVAYASQGGYLYLKFDSDTQMWFIIAFVAQAVVASGTALLIRRLRRNGRGKESK